MNAEGLLQEISDYCRRTGMAETTFGRRAVNDGKFAGRLEGFADDLVTAIQRRLAERSA